MNNKKTLLSVALSCLLFTGHVAAGASVGAYVNYDGWSLNTIDQFNADTARNASNINIFSSFTSNWDSLSIQASNIVSRDSVPLITWMPYNSAIPEGNVIVEIANGQWDAYIDSWIEGFKHWRNSYPAGSEPSILLRFGHEFNGNWYPWGNQPEALKSAWRHMHQRFSDAGLNEVVGWVWCANNVDVDSYDNVIVYYPGDDVVDWISLDGYNWGSNYSFSRWKSFDETFSQQYVKMVTAIPNKPMMLAEVSSAEPHDVPDINWGQNGDDSDFAESKGAWITDMMQNVQTNYPAIKSIVWFNTNKELDWALNLSGNTGLAEYNSSVSTDYFSGRPQIKSSIAPETMTVSTAVAAERQVATEEETSIYVKGKLSDKQKNARADTSKTEKESPRLTGLDKALSVSKMPAVVGQKLLAKEAEGWRNIPKAKLRKWRMERVLNN